MSDPALKCEINLKPSDTLNLFIAFKMLLFQL